MRRAEAGEAIVDTLDFEETSDTNNDDSNEEKIEALTEMICAPATPGNQSGLLARSHGDN